MEDDPIRNDAHRRRNGEKPKQFRVCPRCGRLRSAELFPKHHPCLKKICPGLTLGICTPCHRREHVELENAGVTGNECPQTWPETMIVILKALSVFFYGVADMFWDMAMLGAEFIADLRDQCPNFKPSLHRQNEGATT
jgi:hypothetical protein